MKKIFTLFAAVLLAASVFAQSPEKMSYQAVIRNASEELVTNQAVGMQISILQGSESGTPVYTETQTQTTNANGLVITEIGSGTTSDDFSTIDWGADTYFIKTETDPTGGTSYTITGTSQLLSVPYALHAKTAETVENITVDYADVQNTPDVSGITTNEIAISTNEQAIKDTASQIRADIPDVSGFLTNESDPSVPAGNQTGEMQYWNGSAWITVAAGNEGQVLTFSGGAPTWITQVADGDVKNPITDRIWMDRNLGASQVATSSTDSDAYGDLYQWGRDTDGHEKRTSGVSSTLSPNDSPGHGNFIYTTSAPWDWRSPENGNLWQGVNSTNNPCPSGYRLPTTAEWEAERQSWSSNNIAGAFASPLKLSIAGYRQYNGSLNSVDSEGKYWSSTKASNQAYFMDIAGNAALGSSGRVFGRSVRCIKD